MRRIYFLLIGLAVAVNIKAATETVDVGYLRYTVDTEALTAEVYSTVSA